jgi:hypothetical protein
MLPELVFDEGCHVDRLDLGQILDADAGAECGELADCLQIGAAGVGVADMRTKKVT